MKIKRSVLEQIIKEELRNHIKGLMEAPDNKTDVVDAEKSGKQKKKDLKPKDDKQNTQPPKTDKKPEEKPNDLPVQDETEADKDLEKDVVDQDAEDAEDVTGGKISDKITGKRIQSVTMEPKSRTLPGAQEVVITFNEIPEPLKILITKTGQVKFHFKGLHNKLS